MVVDQFYGLGAVLSPVDGEVRPPSSFTERTDRYPRKEWWSYLISTADWSPSQRQLMRAEVLRRIGFPRIRDPLRLTGRYPGHQLRSEESKSVEFLESARREFRVAEAILNDPVRHQSRLVPSPTMRQGYRLQRPSAVVPQTTDSRPRLLSRARDRWSDPAVPLVLRKIAGAKAISLIGRVKLTCLTTV